MAAEPGKESPGSAGAAGRQAQAEELQNQGRNRTAGTEQQLVGRKNRGHAVAALRQLR